MTNRYFSSAATTANSADSDRYTDYKYVLAAILLLGATASTAVINNNSNNKTTCESAGSIVDIDEKPEYTAEEVAKSNKWYAWYLPPEKLVQEDIHWSLAYYKCNTKPDLYQKVYNRITKYESASRGGSLFLKIILERDRWNRLID